MPATQVTGVPGPQTERTGQYRCVRKSDQGVRYIPGGKIIDGSKSRDTTNTGYLDVLQPGTVMGKVTASGKYAPSIIGLNTVLHDTSVVTTTMTLPAAIVTEIQRRIGTSGTFTITGPPTAAGTVATETVTFSAIASATTITITATSADFAAGSIIAPADGSQTPIALIDDGSGVKVTDDLGVSQDQTYGYFLIGGDLDSSQIVNWSSDTSVQTWLKGQLNSAGSSNFTFDDGM